jgi:hypothetical protein
MFSASMLVLSIGKILDVFKGKTPKAIKWLIYIAFIVYSLYSLAVLTNLNELSPLDLSSILLGIIFPICFMIVGRYLMQIEYKGHKIFTYFTLWLIYMIFAVIWYLIFPEQVLFSLVFMYFIISIFTVWLITKIKGEEL